MDARDTDCWPICTGHHTTPQLWQRVAEDFLDIVVDWVAVDRALAV